MRPSTYSLLTWLSFLLAAASLGLATVTPQWPWMQTVFSTLSGAAFGLWASLLMQKMASAEQTEMIRSVTLEAEGISSLPESFQDLKWLAIATKKANFRGNKRTEWNVLQLTKLGGSGSRFLSYSMKTKNLLGDQVSYKATFIGAQGCVICAISKEHETTSVVTVDTRVSAAGVHFGAAYLTDWVGERDLTLMVVGSRELSSGELKSLPRGAAAAFHHWYKSGDFSVHEAYDAFPIDESGNARAESTDA